MISALLSASPVARALAPLTRDRATIFMLHRFADPNRGIVGLDTGELRRVLQYLRRHRYALVSLGEALRRLRGEGAPLSRAVVFTIDDGYADHAEVAAPVFAEFDVPACIFVTTGFLDGTLWFWWDRIEWIFQHAHAPLPGAIRVGDRMVPCTPTDFTAACKRVPDADKHAAIAALAQTAQTEVPIQPPPQYAPMTWDQLRACEARGITFGPHTVTHPILSRTSDAQSRTEIRESWDRLSVESRAPVPVFCYPNGQAEDFGAREIQTLREAGMLGAVVGRTGYANGAVVRASDEGPFLVPRLTNGDSLPHVAQFASGAGWLRRSLRSASMRNASS